MKTNTKIASIACAACLLTGGIFTSQAMAQGAGVTGGVGVGQKKGAEKREKHPEIMKAIRNLEQAKAALEHADRDFGGHRAKALDATKAAIAECREALKFDKN